MKSHETFFVRATLFFDLTISNIGQDKLNEERSYILDVAVRNIACLIGGSTCSDKGFFNKILYGIWMTLIYTNLLVSKHLLQCQWKGVFKNLAFNISNIESNIEYQGKLLSSGAYLETFQASMLEPLAIIAFNR